MAMTTVLRLPPRPVVFPEDIPDELRKIKEYGPHYKILRYEDRSPEMQARIESSLSAFRSFRRQRGEVLEGTVWELPPPDVVTLQIYLGYVGIASRTWRDANVAALRLYFIHIQRPDLFRMVEAPLAARN